MFDEAANAFEEIEPEEKTRTDVPGAQVNLQSRTISLKTGRPRS